MLKPGLVLQRKKAATISRWVMALVESHKENSHVPVIMSVDVASTVSPYLVTHSFFGRRKEIKNTGCSEATAAVS
jgi:hypothetical protein